MESQAVVASRLEQVDINWRCQVIKELPATTRETPKYLPRGI